MTRSRRFGPGSSEERSSDGRQLPARHAPEGAGSAGGVPEANRSASGQDSTPSCLAETSRQQLTQMANPPGTCGYRHEGRCPRRNVSLLTSGRPRAATSTSWRSRVARDNQGGSVDAALPSLRRLRWYSTASRRLHHVTRFSHTPSSQCIPSQGGVNDQTPQLSPARGGRGGLRPRRGWRRRTSTHDAARARAVVRVDAGSLMPRKERQRLTEYSEVSYDNQWARRPCTAFTKATAM